MKRNIKKISLLVLMFIILLQITIFAEILNIDIKTSKEKVKVGDKVKIIVDWDKGMQAADFALIYDSEKLEFIKSDLKDDYINNKDGEIKTAWFSMDDKDKTKIEYTFKAKKIGKTELKTKVNGGFATGSLLMPTGYNEGEIELEIKTANPILKAFKIIVMIIIVLAIVILFIRKINNKKKGILNKKVKAK